MYRYEPLHEKTNKIENSDLPGHLPSPLRLIWVFAVCSVGSYGPKLPLCGQRILWSDWADAQADLYLRWAHSHCVGFVMGRLICDLWLRFALFGVSLPCTLVNPIRTLIISRGKEGIVNLLHVPTVLASVCFRFLSVSMGGCDIWSWHLPWIFFLVFWSQQLRYNEMYHHGNISLQRWPQSLHLKYNKTRETLG